MSISEFAALIKIIIPPSYNLFIENYEVTDNSIDLYVINSNPVGLCTCCGQPSQRVHSHYQRQLSDLSICEKQIHLHWTIRRFFCDAPNCPRITFSEQNVIIAQKYARITSRMMKKLYAVGLEVGGESGKRVSNLFDVPVSSDKILRIIHHCEIQKPDAPNVLGIDDWAWKKRHTYGTILVDLERRSVIDLLPDRKPETVAVWLKNHPGISIISRDRGKDFIDGIEQSGLLGVIQVADRFHLLHNLLETAQNMMEHDPESIKKATKLVISALKAEPVQVEPHPPTIIPVRHYRQTLFDQVKLLQSQGLSRREITRQLKLDRRTVGKYFYLDVPPNRKRIINSISKTTPYLAYLQKRLSEGCRCILTLFMELKEKGFTGSYVSVLRAVHRLGVENLKTSVPKPSPQLRFSPKQAAWVIFQTESYLKEPFLSLRTSLCEVSPQIVKAENLIRRFRDMVTNRQAENLDIWLIDAEKSLIPEFVRLAASFRKDYDAVRAGLSLHWSNGQVEGQVNRLKLLKRQMYGRAGFDLLRKRVLGPVIINSS